MSLLVLALSLTATLAACAPEDDVVDELGDEFESTSQDMVEGKADGIPAATDYYVVRPDTRKCAFPACGGVFVSPANRTSLRCTDGRLASECYAAQVDFAPLGLTDENMGIAQSATRSGIMLVRGALKATSKTGALRGFANFAPAEVWVSGTDAEPAGLLVRVRDNGTRCISYPCASLTESKINSNLTATTSDLDFEPSGADEDQVAAAQLALMGPNGLIVAGGRYEVTGPGGTGKARRVTQYWTRLGDPVF
jgi:hypothetical protein